MPRRAEIDRAQREPVRVTRRNRVVGIMVSPSDYEAMRVFYADRLRRTLDQTADHAGTQGLTEQHVLKHGRLLFSRETFVELETRLWRPKFDRYLTLEHRQSLLDDFSAAAEWVELDQDGKPRHDRMRFSRDPGDDKFVWTALVGDADWLVSGDADLLDLARVLEKVRILSPAQARALIRKAD